MGRLTKTYSKPSRDFEDLRADFGDFSRFFDEKLFFSPLQTYVDVKIYGGFIYDGFRTIRER
jgi:hypothetical protein